MNVKNLKTLIDFFEQLPDEKVGLNYWRARHGHDDYVNDHDLANECGTVGCLVGWLPVLTGVDVPYFTHHQLAEYLGINVAISVTLSTNCVSYDERLTGSDRAIVLNRLRSLL
jgi:hypothetical protein